MLLARCSCPAAVVEREQRRRRAELLLSVAATRLSSALYLQLSDVDVGLYALMPQSRRVVPAHVSFH